MKKTMFAYLVILLLVVSCSLVTITQWGSSKEISEFAGGLSNDTVTFTAAGSDDTTKIHINTSEKVKSIRFNISNGDYLGDYPLSPTMDIGDDGDLEWAYDQAGYGSWGHVDQFSTGAQEANFNLKSGTTLSHVSLPAGAQVTSAHLDVQGIFDTTYQKHVAAPDGPDNVYSLDNGDMNGDGYEDIVGVENIDGGDLFWLENPTTGAGDWTYHTVDNLYYGYQSLLTDMDSDLDNDIVLSIRASGGGIKWYENDNGDGSAWTEHDINMSFAWAGAFTLTDINGNGSEDIVLLADHHNWGRLAWIEKPGNLSHNWTTHIINESISYMSYLDTFDLDGDTHQDIILTRDHWNTGGIYLFEGPDDPVNDTWNGYKVAYFGGPLEVSISDLDADTHPDIIVANASYNRVTWFESPDTPFTGVWTPHDMATGISAAKGVELADMDGDSLLDVVTAAHGGESAYWLEQPSSGVTNPWTAHQCGSSIYDTRLAIPMDIDQANELDIAAYGFDFSQMVGLIENGAGGYQQIDISEIATGTPSMVVTGDFDGENVSDVAFISYSGDSLCVRRSGTDPSNEWTLDVVDTTLVTPYGLNATDLDKDGDPDLIVCDFHGNDIYWYENRYDTDPGSPWIKHIVSENVPQGEYRYLITGDIDGTNTTDIIVYERWTDNSNHANNCLVWFEAPADPTNSSQTWQRHVIATNLRGVLSMALSDFDRDGYNDLVFTQYRYSSGYIGNISWARHPTGFANSGDKWQVRLISIDHAYPVGLGCVNIDDDDIPDIVVTDYHMDSLKWYKTPDDPITSSWDGYYIDFNLDYGGYLDAMDLGNDGKSDIVVVDTYNDRIVWYTAPADPTVALDWVVTNLDTAATWANDVAFGDFSGDGLIDVAGVGTYPGRVYWYDLIPLYSPSAELDVGYDSTSDWTITDLVNRTTSPDLTAAFNLAIAQQIPEIDTRGNEIVKVPLMLSGPGRNATLLGVDVTYDVTHTITGVKIINELNEYLDNHNSTDTVDIPIRVSSASGGKIVFSDLMINLNEAPVLLADIPSNQSVDEDNKNDILIDLRTYYNDDYTDVNGLTYSLESYTEHYNVDVSIGAGYFVSVDATKVENWYGKSEIVVSATDGDGFKTFSNSFNVTINSINDEPVAGPDDLQKIIMDEGTSYILNLSAKQYFVDPDGDRLYYDTNIVQQLPNIQGNLTIEYDPSENTLNFAAADDWTIAALRLEIYCDDQENVSKSLSKSIEVDVLNILEPLAWEMLPIINVNEDDSTSFDLKPYVRDPDHPNSPVSFYITDYENESYIDIDLNPNGKMDIQAHSNFHGDSIVKLNAENQFNSETSTLYIMVGSVNDEPVLSGLTPGIGDVFGSTEVQVSWSAVDVDVEDELEFVISLEESGGEITTYETSQNHYTLTGLSDNSTYYWDVSATDGTATVTSEQRWFRISFEDAPKYDLEIDCPAMVRVDLGEKKNVIITITNNEAVQNHVTPWIDEMSEDISSFVDLLDESTTVYVSPGEEKQIFLVIDLTEYHGSGDFFIALKFQNGMNNQIEDRNITVRVAEDEEPADYTALVFVLFIILILVIIIVLVAFFIMKKRKKEDEGSFFVGDQEEEEVVDKPLPPSRPDGVPHGQEIKMKDEIEDGLSKILENANVDEQMPGIDGDIVLEPEVEDSSPFDEEEGPVDIEEAMEESPAMDITPVGEEEAEETLEVQFDDVEPQPDYKDAVTTPREKTRYSYTYSKQKKKLKTEDELVELKPVEEEEEEEEKPKKRSKGKSKKKGTKQKKKK